MTAPAVTTTPLWKARKKALLTRPEVVSDLKPPISVATLKRWEKAGKVPERSHPEWYLPQLAELYGVSVDILNGRKT